ncbi:DUF998 domain-containing protein [Microbacterium aurantiacum]|uniref:DUF998 domain-containing protein n=1 Tax=Microbacterium aurantiacum TaxID=162393 RepID=UPI001FE3900D|nr:DUF998 domain-containing protein [Microbacterium aurantiacum]
MDDQARRLQQETRAIWAAVVCFIVGTGAGMLLLQGVPRPLAGDGSVVFRAAGVAAICAAAAFVASTLLHRRGETKKMPRWQAVVSDLSAIALTIAFAGVTAMGVLLAGEILGVGLQGLELPAIGGGLITGVASAIGGRFAFDAGIRLSTGDLAGLLFGYLIVGTLFAMLTAADPRWWERNFSQLGIGIGAWAFNGTLVIAGLLVATVGAYIGRDLHRLLGDESLRRIGRVVVLWAATGVALAGVGLFPLHAVPVPHNIAAFAALALFGIAAVSTTLVMPAPPRALVVTTIAVTVMVVLAVVLWVPFGLYSVTALEAMVIGLGLVWMTTLVRMLAIVVPAQSRPSLRATLLGR